MARIRIDPQIDCNVELIARDLGEALWPFKRDSSPIKTVLGREAV